MASPRSSVRAAGRIRGGRPLIFVTVGTHDAPFDRLVRRMDALAGATEEPVWMQVGHASVPPTLAAYRRFFPRAEYGRLFGESRAVVSHAGVGTLLEAARARKPLVCAPRQRRFGEHWDDHQLEMCEELARSGTLHYVEDPDDLSLDVLARAKPPAFPNPGNGLARRVAGFLREAGGRTTPNGPHP